jgi:putative holliday junction resolvase
VTQERDTNANSKKTGKILALDYGRSRIGVAIADKETGLARPLATLERINRNEDMRRLRELARDERVTQIIVGLPLRLDGTRGEMAEEAAKFGERVRKQIGVPVEMVDERLTSWEAERLLEEQGGRVLKRAGRVSSRKNADGARGKEARSDGLSVDAVAATLLLKDYLER